MQTAINKNINLHLASNYNKILHNACTTTDSYAATIITFAFIILSFI